MAQKHRPTAGSTCPGCDEPLEPGDRFCGACGYDLSAVPAVPQDRPTVAIGTPVEWPAATGTDTMGTPTPTQRAADVPGTDSDGGELPPTGTPGAPAAEAAAAGGTGVPGATAPGAAAPGAPVPSQPAHGTAAGLPGSPAPSPAPTPAPAELGADAGDHGHESPGTGTAGQAVHGHGTAAPGAGAADPVTGAGQPASGVRFDDPPSGDFELAAPAPGAAPDPRAPAAPPAAVAPSGAKLCVACRAGRVDTDGYCENCGHAQPRERDHMEQELGPVAAVSDRGLRHHRNEDSFAVSATALPDGSPAVVAVVCDGVSSATRPDEASAAAASAANERLLAALPRGTHPQQAMHEAIVAASEAVNSLAGQPEQAPGEEHRHQNAPACTIVGAVAAGGLLVVGWVGDSRAYWVPDDRSGPPARLTEDDSWAAQMVAAGLMNEAEAYADERAHAITGWLGADAYELEPHTAAFKPDRSGVVVVCTDGLWNYAEGAEEMARAVPVDAAERPLHSAQMLVGHALDGGGHDNVTVAVLPFAVPRQGAGSAQDMA
ncbi:PP2C family serine/threonine-protein phosphatase [Streptomyces sp. NPDC006540]|uniref:PP2C family serine/threonine-protein phosphatase n=1 Tax=Streptomyces sp. NPDC006540 TaxID=3155353 RepID=UPI00339E42D2